MLILVVAMDQQQTNDHQHHQQASATASSSFGRNDMRGGSGSRAKTYWSSAMATVILLRKY